MFKKHFPVGVKMQLTQVLCMKGSQSLNTLFYSNQIFAKLYKELKKFTIPY